jgi:dTDP-4-amino-4,6-dideoxygalactose transaminase
MIPRFRPNVDWSEICGIFWGKKLCISDFEKAYAEFTGSPEAVWFPSGRLAIMAFLQSADVQGRQVVTAAFNCVALGTAIVRSGWRPLYVDTEVEGYNQNLDEFFEALEHAKASAGILVSQWGMCPEIARLKNRKKPLLYDFALALPMHEFSLPLETDGMLISLGWGKPLGFLGGAMLCTRGKESASKWRAWRDSRLEASRPWQEALSLVFLKTVFNPTIFQFFHGFYDRLPISRRLSGQVDVNGNLSFPKHTVASSPRLLNLSWGKIQKELAFKRERQAQIETYFTILSEIPELRLPDRDSVLSHFPIRLKRRDYLRNSLLKLNIFTSDQLFKRLLSDYPALDGEAQSDLRNSRTLTETTLHLPLFVGLNNKTQIRIALGVREVLRKN